MGSHIYIYIYICISMLSHTLGPTSHIICQLIFAVLHLQLHTIQRTAILIQFSRTELEALAFSLDATVVILKLVRSLSHICIYINRGLPNKIYCHVASIDGVLAGR